MLSKTKGSEVGMSMKSDEEKLYAQAILRIILRKMTPQSLLEYNPDNKSGMCPWCGQRLNIPIKRCTNCGQAVKWDD